MVVTGCLDDRVPGGSVLRYWTVRVDATRGLVPAMYVSVGHVCWRVFAWYRKDADWCVPGCTADSLAAVRSRDQWGGH